MYNFQLLTDLSFFVQYHITTLVAGEHIKSPIYKYLFTYRSSVGLLKSFRNIGNGKHNVTLRGIDDKLCLIIIIFIIGYSVFSR